MHVIDVLLANLDEAYDRKGWHGPTLRGSLRGVTRDEALWRPKEGAHSIWDYVLHTAYWKHAVRRRLTGDRRSAFPLKGKNFFAIPARPNEESWHDSLLLLSETHKALRRAIASLGPRELEDKKKVRMIYGIAAHDLYHAGQIQLLKRLQR